MSTKTPVVESCPFCGVLHEMGEYQNYTEGEKTVSSPPDIVCSCGTISRWFVPLFKVNESGSQLRLKKESETTRS